MAKAFQVRGGPTDDSLGREALRRLGGQGVRSAREPAARVRRRVRGRKARWRFWKESTPRKRTRVFAANKPRLDQRTSGRKARPAFSRRAWRRPEESGRRRLRSVEPGSADDWRNRAYPGRRGRWITPGPRQPINGGGPTMSLSFLRGARRQHRLAVRSVQPLRRRLFAAQTLAAPSSQFRIIEPSRTRSRSRVISAMRSGM